MGMSGLTQRGVPPQPAFLRIIKFVVLFLSVIVLALAAYAISIFSGAYGYYGNGGVSGLLIFACVKTWIIFGIALFLEMRAQHFFWRLILVIAYFISIIFWLSAWAWSASIAGLWLSASGDFNCTYDDNFNYVCDNNSPYKREGAALAACAGLGAVIWVLLIVHFAFFVLACMRSPQGTNPGSNQAELGQVKAQEAYPAQQQAYPQQQQPAHPQQPYPAQQPYEQQPYQQPHQQTYPAQ